MSRVHQKEQAVARINAILGYRKSYWNSDQNSYNLMTDNDLMRLTSYGLGHKRTLDQFIAFTGVDTRSHFVFENKCKNLVWVPFVPDRDSCTDESDMWGQAPERVITSAYDATSSLAESHSHQHSAEFNTLFYGNHIPLVVPGKKQHISMSLLTRSGGRNNAAVQVPHGITPGAGADTNAGKNSVPISAFVQVWNAWFGWWFDSWVGGFAHLLSMMLPAEASSEANSILITKFVLLLFPMMVFLLGCVMLLNSDDVEDTVVENAHRYDSIKQKEEVDIENTPMTSPSSSAKKKRSVVTPGSHSPKSGMKARRN